MLYFIWAYTCYLLTVGKMALAGAHCLFTERLIYSSALIIGKFIKAERLLRSVLIPALSETNIPTTHSFLQSPLQTFNCRMIQANLSSQISLYSQGRAVSPRVFQSTAIGCPVLDSMTVFFPNNSASHKKIMIQAAKIA